MKTLPQRLHSTFRRHGAAAVALGAWAVVAMIAAWLPAWSALERAAFDRLTVQTAPDQVGQPIVLVAIDEDSLAAMQQQWPWPRRLHADLIDRLARGHAAVVAFDILFAEPSSGEDDAALARAIHDAGNVVLASEFRYSETALARLWKRTDPLPAFLQAGAIPGLATVPFDPDHVVRQIPAEPDALWRQVIKVLQVRAPAQPIPPLPSEGALVRYLGSDHIFDPVPYHLVLGASDAELATVFSGRIVLVGRDLRATPELGLAQAELFATPFLAESGALTSGVKIHATLIANALSGHWLRPLPALPSAILQALAALAAFVAFRRWEPWRASLLAVALVAAVVGLSWWAFAQADTWIAPVAPATVVLVAWAGFAARSYFAEVRRKREIQRAFSRYLAPDLVERIAADPSRLALGGESREITVMFTDIAGFTRLTEQTSPEVVTRVLIMHFDAMTDVIHAHAGTVVQFVGDAIMAFWNAPLDDADHALHAVRAAIEMQQGMERLRAELRAAGLPELHIRIGVNTCTAVVGNMGSHSRFYYTAIGDGINLGARLEGANKHYGTEILASGETVAQLSDRIAMRRVDRIKVAGKSQPVDVYTPASDATLVQRTAQAFEAYLQRDWELAARLYAEMCATQPDDGVAARLRERITAWRKEPALAAEDGSASLDKL